MKLPIKTPSTETVIERINAFKLGQTLQLSATDQAVMERADFADNLIRNDLHKNDREIALKIHSQFNVSVVTAYEDIRRAKMLYASMKQFEKPYWIPVLIDHARNILGKAIDSRNIKLMITAFKELRETIAMLPEESNDPLDKVQKHNYFLVIKNQNGGAIQLNLNNTEKLTQEQIAMLEESLQNDFLTETIDIMHEQVSPDQ